MLSLTLVNQVIDLTWPDGRRLVLYGPTDREPMIRVATPDNRQGRHVHRPGPNRRAHIEVAGLSFGLIGPDRHDRGACSVRFDVPREVKVTRRRRDDRRRAS